MKTILMIYAIAFTIATPKCAHAFDYDVDMPNSGDPKYEMIRIRIDACESKFKIKKEDFEKFSKSPKEMQKLVKKAIERTYNGCK